MRLSGGILVWISMLLAGMAISLRLKKRRDFLGETVIFFTTAIVDIEYINLPLTDILENVKKSETCRQLDFIEKCISKTAGGEDFNIAWVESIKESDLPFTRDEQEKLISLGGLLGRSDAQGQRSILALFLENFNVFFSKAEETYKKYGRISITVSCFLGMGVFVMML